MKNYKSVTCNQFESYIGSNSVSVQDHLLSSVIWCYTSTKTDKQYIMNACMHELCGLLTQLTLTIHTVTLIAEQAAVNCLFYSPRIYLKAN